MSVKVCFLGAGEIAVPVLKALAADPRLELVLVGTQPDRPAGRKRILTPTPVGAAAALLGLTARRISNVNAPEFLAELRRLAPDVILVVSFGQLFKKELLELPRCGCINVHASLLPRYRGASPIIQAVLNGDDETGVSFMRMEAGLDSGPVCRVVRMPLHHTEFVGPLELALGEKAAQVTGNTLLQIADGTLEFVRQDESAVTRCGKICKEDGIVDWCLPARRIEAMVRAYTPWPGVRSTLLLPESEIPVILQRVELAETAGVVIPGQILGADRAHGIVVACGEGALRILELSTPGSRTMPAAAFLNGLRGVRPTRFLIDPA